MVTAIVLISAERKKVNELADYLANIPSISEVYSVAGRYDLIAIIRAPNNERLAEIITSDILKIEGVSKTETLIALKCCSRFDLESIFGEMITE